MKQQDIKTEEQFMGQNIWISLSAGIVCLLLCVYSLIKQDQHIGGFLAVGMGVFFI